MGYAIAYSDYNILLHQPQPPGYILYIAVGKVVNVLLNDPNSSMIFINIIFSILTVILIYLLAKEMFSRNFGIITAILFVFNPFFWFYGEVASVYVMGAFFAVLIAYTSFKVFKGDEKFIYISAAALGLAGGFRQEIILFMIPLWLFCIFYIKLDYKKLLLAFFVLIVAVMIWFIPNLVLAGGYDAYSMVSNAIMMESLSTSSIFFGAGINSQLLMDFRLIVWTLVGMGMVGAFLLILFLFYNFKMVFRGYLLKNIKIIFLLLWIFPAFIFYLIFYIAKPGYILLYLPAFTLMITYAILEFSKEFNNIFKSIPQKFFIYVIVLMCITSGIVQFINPSQDVQGGIVDYGKIKTADESILSLNQSLNQLNYNDTIILMSNEDRWRIATYYFPEFETYTYYSRISSGRTIYGIRHYNVPQMSRSESEVLSIKINSSKTKILWMVDNQEFIKELKTKIDFKTIKLPNGMVIYYSEIKNNSNFMVFNFKIIKI